MVLLGGVVVCAEALGAMRKRNKRAVDTNSRIAADRKVRGRANRMERLRENLPEGGKGASSNAGPVSWTWLLALRAVVAFARTHLFYGQEAYGAIRGVPETGME
jgi:hypothetical protein